MPDSHASQDADTLLAAVPAPLATRVTGGQLILGVYDIEAGAWDRAWALGQALYALSGLPLRLLLINRGNARQKAPQATDIPLQVEVIADTPATLAPILPQLEALLLPASEVARYQASLTPLAIPLLAQLPADAQGWEGPGLGVSDAQPRELAGLLLLLATDPPTRRRALDSQCQHLQAQGGTLSQHWRMEGVFDSSYSLAIVNRRLAMALDTPNTPAALFTYEQGDHPAPHFEALEDPVTLRRLWQRGQHTLAPAVALRNAWPPVVRDMRGHRRILANYAWEETRFPEAYAQDFNRVLDLITVVSHQTARFLQDAGTRVPIAVVGNGVDHLAHIAPEPPPVTLPEGFRFLHVSSCFPRKGVDVLLKAYGQAFRAHHPVVLIIKTFPNPHNDVREQLQQHIDRDPGYPRVDIIMDDWSPAQMTGLYQACQALVAPSRGEGFGLPMAEAMIHRLPVIVTGWGGHRDFCNDDTAWLVDFQLTPANTHLSEHGSLWAEPDANDLVRRLRELYITPSQTLQPRLDKARDTILSRYTWAEAARRTRQALEHINAQPGPLAPEPVGWVSTWGSRCGIAAYSAHLSARFEPDQLHVFAPLDETVEQPDPAHVTRNWHLGGQGLEAIVEAAEARGLKAMIIQHHWGFYTLDTLARFIEALSQRGIRICLDMHNTRGAPAAVREPRYHAALSRCDRILVHTQDDIRCVQDWGLADNITLFPLAVYPIPRPDAGALAARRQALGLDGRQVLATYGFLMPHKGLPQVIEALPALRRQHPDLHLLMVNARYTPEVSDPEHKRLQARIRELGLEDHVTLETRFLPEAECLTLLGLADLVVFPYQRSRESSSAAVRMACGAGRPIAVTPLDIFEDVAPATLTLPGADPESLAQGIGQCLSQLRDADFREQAGRQALEFANTHDARRLSRRLRDMVTGLMRQVEGEA
ncbi:Glycosyltransferase involved in cell wall bisynthesis [Ectothiorhodospira mobilis]|uniref:Glycosyltransferase involved in cell wall bisynthesis n=1 Tax=Ectothiorhodospira mobilis TaxID=195064 RepID=A0A1I4SIU0_ECTMO|nr:glycosyltransferase [Ectothiorhodospira mobilis]SFM64365.1 Glycosyltransferase involved in cell wall bisynthesis [Ectothiorhodospira mobilis]